MAQEVAQERMGCVLERPGILNLGHVFDAPRDLALAKFEDEEHLKRRWARLVGSYRLAAPDFAPGTHGATAWSGFSLHSPQGFSAQRDAGPADFRSPSLVPHPRPLFGNPWPFGSGA